MIQIGWFTLAGLNYFADARCVVSVKLTLRIYQYSSKPNLGGICASRRRLPRARQAAWISVKAESHQNSSMYDSDHGLIGISNDIHEWPRRSGPTWRVVSGVSTPSPRNKARFGSRYPSPLFTTWRVAGGLFASRPLVTTHANSRGPVSEWYDCVDSTNHTHF